MKKKLTALVLFAALMLAIFAGCSTTAAESTATAEPTEAPQVTDAPETDDSTDTQETSFDASSDIMICSREEGSGTRGAFIELFGVEEKDADGNKVDNTTMAANITNSTGVMMTTVAGNPYAIGYISLGSLDSSVKALKIDGVEATVENIKAGSYAVSRPFNIATQATVSESTQDFIDFIMSSDGQAIIEDNGYIPVAENAEAYAGNGPTEKIVVAGSSSVTPVMEKLKEAYLALYPDASIELQTSDSTTGMNSVVEGTCDIGMASRALKDSEIEGGAVGITIAMDGIAVVVNNENPLEDIAAEQVKSIYVGETTNWSAIVK